MHVGEQIPKVALTTPMEEVVYEMSRKGLGIAVVVDPEEKVTGVISDGDLRRLLQSRRERVLDQTAGECMTRSPITIGPEELAASALNLMEQRKITCLLVTDQSARIIGVIHLHDLWGTEMF